MKSFTSALLVVLGLSGGWLCSGWIFPTERGLERLDGPVVRQGAWKAGTSLRQSVATVPVERHDLKSLLRWHLQQKSGGLEIINRLQSMDSAGLRDLMTVLVAARTEVETPEIRMILSAAAAELFRRDGEKALDWANGLDPASGRQTLLNQMIIAAATELPGTAKPWINRYNTEFGESIYHEFAWAAVTGATSRGAEDLLRLKKLYGDGLNGCPFPTGPYPDGFDFRLLVTSLPFDPDLRASLACWTARDRDAAWAGIKEVIERDGNLSADYFGSLFTGIAATEGDGEAARWMASKLDELPPDLRERAISSILTSELRENASY